MNDLQRIKIGPWTANPALNVLERDSKSSKIEPRAMDVLVFLARHGGVVSVEELMASVWKGVVVGDGSVYLAIRQLRLVLDESSSTSYIETIPKRGYRLVVPAELEPISALVAAQAPRNTATPDVAAGIVEASTKVVPSSPSRRTSRVRRVALAAAILCAIVIGAVSIVRNRNSSPAIRSVAVLPFENLSSDPEHAYFADGVTEEILNTLSGVRDLRVIGRTSSFQFKDQKKDPSTVATLLDVEHVLEGSVRKAGNQVRIGAKLSNARTGQQLWTETYERKLDDVFAIQDEIAKSVAKALQIKLSVGDIGRVPGMTRNVAAYDEYLRAVALNLDGSFAPAIAHLQRAIALDPSFSVALSAMDAFYTNGALGMPPEQAKEWQRLGAEALERARVLTPDAPHVLLQAAIREARRGNWLGAAPLYDALQPSYEKYGFANQSWGPRGVFLLYVGREREAIPALERARAENPLAPVTAIHLAQAYLARGDPAAAFLEIDRGATLERARERLQRLGFWIALNKADRAEIERRLQALRAASDKTASLAVHDELMKLLDSPAAAEAEIRRMASSASANGKIGLSLWAAYFHAPELSLELLAEQATNGEVMPLLWQPLMTDVRKLPAFKEFARRAGLLDYWRAYGWSDFCRPIGTDDFACN